MNNQEVKTEAQNTTQTTEQPTKTNGNYTEAPWDITGNLNREDTIEIAKAVREQYAKMSQDEFAIKIGYKLDHYKGLENNIGNISPNLLIKIADAFGMQIKVSLIKTKE